jgi:hypothetical protein
MGNQCGNPGDLCSDVDIELDEDTLIDSNSVRSRSTSSSNTKTMEAQDGH